MSADRDERLSGAGRGAEDEIGAGDDLDERFILGRVEGQTASDGPFGELRIDGIRIVGSSRSDRSQPV